VIIMCLRALSLFVIGRDAGQVGLHLMASLFYVHNLVYNHFSIINPPAWSLEIEIQFYLLAPLFTTIFMVRPKALRRVLLVAITLGSGLAAELFITPNTRASLSLLAFFQYFVAGFLLCDLYLSGDRPPLPKWCWDVLGVLALVWIFYSQWHWYQVALPFATLVLYLAGFYGSLVRAFFSLRAISIIGGMCYSLYLTHTIVLTAFTPIAHRLMHSALPAFVMYSLIIALSLAGVLLVGSVFFVLVERPCMNPEWPHKLALKLGLSPQERLVR
jgi:peptidoglycan/LPS O-acetylase OafA/YrhL